MFAFVCIVQKNGNKNFSLGRPANIWKRILTNLVILKYNKKIAHETRFLKNISFLITNVCWVSLPNWSIEVYKCMWHCFRYFFYTHKKRVVELTQTLLQISIQSYINCMATRQVVDEVYWKKWNCIKNKLLRFLFRFPFLFFLFLQ